METIEKTFPMGTDESEIIQWLADNDLTETDGRNWITKICKDLKITIEFREL